MRANRLRTVNGLRSEGRRTIGREAEEGWRRGSLLRPATVLLAVVLSTAPAALDAQSLRGSLNAMRRQNEQARAHDYTFLRNSSHVTRFVELGLLVRLPGNDDYRLHAVSFPYARREVKTFVERLSSQFRRACGEVLTVTSLTRPKSRQPRNSSKLSVHPTGMAVDLRRPHSRACRAWLEDVLLRLEAAGTLEATRERRPPHYHVALYPNPYKRYVAQLEARKRTQVAQAPPSVVRYRVRNGDSLWEIARAYGTTVARLREANKLRDSRIYPGQRLHVPVASSS